MYWYAIARLGFCHDWLLQTQVYCLCRSRWQLSKSLYVQIYHAPYCLLYESLQLVRNLWVLLYYKIYWRKYLVDINCADCMPLPTAIICLFWCRHKWWWINRVLLEPQDHCCLGVRIATHISSFVEMWVLLFVAGISYKW